VLKKVTRQTCFYVICNPPKKSGVSTVRTIFHYVIRLVLAVALIVGAGKLFKFREKVTIDANDQSIDQIQYPSGGYYVNTSANTPSQVQQNDVVAYWLSGQPEPKVARVAAVEGQTIEFNGTAVLVNGAPTKYTPGVPAQKWPPVKVPHGCVFLICDKPMFGTDSTKLGPIPSYAIYGKLK
jgi:signal peptidase I